MQKMEMNEIIKDYVEERLYKIQDITWLSFMLCCQSFFGVLHACLSRNVDECRYVDDQEIESMIGEDIKKSSLY